MRTQVLSANLHYLSGFDLCVEVWKVYGGLYDCVVPSHAVVSPLFGSSHIPGPEI